MMIVVVVMIVIKVIMVMIMVVMVMVLPDNASRGKDGSNSGKHQDDYQAFDILDGHFHRKN